MTDRHDQLSERARWFLTNFDEIDLADLCATQEAANKARQDALDRVRQLADKWIKVPTAAVYGPDINSYGRAVLDALSDGQPTPAATEATDLQQRLTALRDRWQAAGPPPGISRWWDIRLAELDTAINGQPTHDAGPTVREAADADRNWPLEKHGE